MSECHVLCVMLERVLRTCPDGAGFPFFLQATSGFRMLLSGPVLPTFAFNMNLRLAAEWPRGYRDNFTSERSLWIRAGGGGPH